MLRIFSAFAFLSTGVIFVFGVFDFKRENPQIEQILQQPMRLDTAFLARRIGQVPPITWWKMLSRM